MKVKYFIYCRKSSESEDKQILSLPAQERELKTYAKEHDLDVVDVISESKSAFKMGREGYSDMLARIIKGEANGILCWHANRLSRNAVDAGYVIYALDQKQLLEIKTQGRTYYNTPNDKFLLGLELGISKKDSDWKSGPD